MKKILFLTSILALTLTSCFNKEELSTDQYNSTAVVLQAYGPQPVVRGGTLRFIGSNLDKVKTVVIPEDNQITDIQVVTAGAHSEIRVTVPKETSAPGYPKLILADGTEIVGKTQLQYSEPITIDEVTPAAYPGDEITFKGDYFNLIHEVVFEKGVVVSEDAFTKHTRYEISVIVPATAKTGKVSLGTIDESKVDPASAEGKTLLATLNLVSPEADFVVKTAEGTVVAGTYKPNAEVVINGTRLDLVKKIVLEGATLDINNTNKTKLTFAMPATAQTGTVTMVMESGVEVAAGSITSAAPAGLAVAPAPVKNGSQITITGTDLDLVTGIDLPKVSGAEFALADGKITLTVGEKAQEGNITLWLANGLNVTVPYTLVKPIITAFSDNPASAGSPVTFTGTDLDLVAKVAFVGAQEGEDVIYLDAIEVEATETTITVSVPTAAIKSNVKLILKNGEETLSADELDIDKPAGAYIGVMPDTVYNPGDMFIVDIENPDHLTGVQVDGVDVNYILGGSTLYFQIPDTAKADSQLTLVSDNGSVTYTMNIDPGTEVSYVIWSGNEDLGSWSNQPYVGEFGALTTYGAVPGDVIRFYLTGNADWWQMQIYDGNWGGQVCDPVTVSNTPDGVFELVLTQELIDKLNGLDNWGGLFVVQGEGCSITQITLTHYIPQETVIWTGSEDLGSWSNQPYIGEFGALVTYNIEPGAKVRFYITPNADWWQMQIYDGNWGGQVCDAPNAENTPDGIFDLELTQELIDKLNGLDNWGGLFVVQGEGCTVTQVSLIHIVK